MGTKTSIVMLSPQGLAMSLPINSTPLPRLDCNQWILASIVKVLLELSLRLFEVQSVYDSVYFRLSV